MDGRKSSSLLFTVAHDCIIGNRSLKIAQPRTLFRLCSVFSSKHYFFLQQINVKNVTGQWDSNSQPSAYESPPLTTGPGLPPIGNRSQ